MKFEYTMTLQNNVEDSLEYKMKDLHDAIEGLRKNPELDEICFMVYPPGEDINSCRAALEEEAKKYGYNIYFESGNVGTKLGMLKDLASDYWE